ncbi:MAG: camphor resistance protein CrcB [Campylobacteraceae bacterium 4484_4]|nr:MAG: camphor resistance protein CrcB [Campylobacteraceae bacterium 4484_4]
MLLLFVGVGGFFGAIGRYLISGWVQKAFGGFFPYGTLGVNVLGSFLIGFLVLYFESHIAPQYKALVITGFLGALTTFSTFSYETVAMLQDGNYPRALLSILLNVILSIGATVAGMGLFARLYH